MKNKLLILILVLLVGTLSLNCKKDDPATTTTPDTSLDINKLHSGSKKTWYWKTLDGSYENPLNVGDYHTFHSNGEMFNQASNEKPVYYWEYSKLKDDIDDSGKIFKKDVKNWIGFYTKLVEGNKTTKLFDVRRYEITKLTDTRMELINITGDGKTIRVYETTK